MTLRSTFFATLTLVGLASSAHAESDAGGGNCRRFVPSAGVTVAVACAEVAALAEQTSAQPSVSVAKKQKTDAVVTEDQKAAPAAVVPSAPSSQPEADKPEPTKVAAPVQTKKAVAAPKAKRSGMKVCVEILERAKAGMVRDGDVQTLREGCGRVG
jgi:hypothetical protein